MPARCSINQRAARARRPAVVGRGLSEGLGLTLLPSRALFADSLTLISTLLAGWTLVFLLLPVAVDAVQAVADPVEATGVLAVAGYVAWRIA